MRRTQKSSDLCCNAMKICIEGLAAALEAKAINGHGHKIAEQIDVG
jgi:hypothetical protein